MIILKNNAQSVLAVPVSEEQTLLNLSLGDGAIFPDLSLGDHFRCALKDSAGNLEFVKVTQRSGDMLTVERGQEGTVARSWQAGTRIQLRMTAKTWEEMASYHMQRVSDADGTPLLPTRTSDTTFTLPGDLTALFEQSRAITIHGSDGEKVSGYVASAGFDSEFTTVTIEGMTLPSSILLLELGLPLGVHPKASNAAPAAHLNDPNAHAELLTPLGADTAEALLKAEEAKTTADGILAIATSAQTTAEQAKATAEEAKTTANSKQDALDFTPVQQSGGTGQLTNKVYLGWSGSGIKIQVDQSDLGHIVTSEGGCKTAPFATRLAAARTIIMPASVIGKAENAIVYFDGGSNVTFSCAGGCTSSCGSGCAGTCSGSCTRSCGSGCNGNVGDSCFIDGRFMTGTGLKHVSSLQIGDAIRDIHGTFHPVVAILQGPVGNKRALRIGNAVMTDDHILWENGPVSFRFPQDDSGRFLHQDGVLIGAYKTAPAGRASLPAEPVPGNGLVEFCPVVLAEMPVWADFSGVTVQLAVAE